MKILHLSIYLPDHRVEKTAYLAKKAGHKIFFAGTIKPNYKPPSYAKKLFDDYFQINISPKNILGLNLKPIVKKIKQYLEENDVELIHAHNVFSANIADHLDIAYVLDDHEFYSFELPFISIPIKRFKEYFSHLIMKYKYPKIEKKVTKKWPFITVSPLIIKAYQKRNPTVKPFLVPNLPLLEDIANNNLSLKRDSNKLVSMYVGVNDFTNNITYRNTKGLLELWNENGIGELIVMGDRFLKSSPNVRSLGFITQEEVYKQLNTGHLGIIGWHPHPYHQVCSLNKIYNYIHCGLDIIYPNSLNSGFEISKIFSSKLNYEFGFAFKDFNEIKDHIKVNYKKYLNANFEKVKDLAQKHFVLNNYKDNLINAYKLAIEIGKEKRI